jgi:hypothetical protein
MIQIETTREKVRESIIVIAAGFLVVYRFLEQDWAIWVSLGILVIGAFSDALSKLIHIGWMKLAQGMGFIMSKILLSSIFFLFLTPIALLYRLLGNKTQKKEDSTYYFTRDHQYTGKDLNQVW